MAVRDVSGKWTIDQTNGFQVVFDLEQGPDNGGTASVKGSATTAGLDGGVTGFVTASTFAVVIDWDRSGPGRGGEYDGNFQVVDADGRARLSGITFDLDHPASSANWRSRNDSRTFRLR